MAFTDKKIDIDIKTVGIQSLKDRPNQHTDYGGNNLSAAQMKEKFDLLPGKIIEAFNNLVTYLVENDYSSEIKIYDTKYTTLAALVTAIRDGGLAEILKVQTDEEQTLTDFVTSVGNGDLANSLRISDTEYTTLAALVTAIRGITLDEEKTDEYLSDIMNVRVGEGFKNIKTLSDAIKDLYTNTKTSSDAIKDLYTNTKTSSDAINDLYKITPLIVDEVIDLTKANVNHDNVQKGYTNSIDAISLNKDPKVGERFWCLIKTKDNYIFSAVAEITGKKNEKGFYPFKLVEADVIYDPTKTLHLKSETEQVVDSDVKFKKNVTVEGDLNVFGEYTTSEVQSLIVKDRFIVCNDGKSTLSSGIVIRKGDVLEDGMINAYNAYGIILDPDTEVVRLGRGYVSNKYPHLGFVPSFTFGYVEQDEQGHLLYTEEQGQAISTRADSGDIKDGNLVKWDAEQNKMVGAGVKILPEKLLDGGVVTWSAEERRFKGSVTPSTSPTPGTIPIRNGSGAIRVGYQTGAINFAANIRTVEEAQSFAYVDYFTKSSNATKSYSPFRLAAKGWRPDGPSDGYLTGVPTDKGGKWFQKIANGANAKRTLTIRDCLRFAEVGRFGNKLDDVISIFTDKIQAYRSNNNDLILEIAPRCTVYIQCYNTEKDDSNEDYSQISIT